MGKVIQDLTGTSQPRFKFGGHRLNSAAGTVTLEDRYAQASPLASFDADHYTLGGKRFFFGTQIPVAGSYLAGDVVWNTSPGDGTVGWFCTLAGTPGTWSVFNGSGGGGGTSSNLVTYHVLTQDLLLTDTSTSVHYVNPNGAARTVRVDASAEGLEFKVVNVDGNFDLHLNDGATLATTLSNATGELIAELVLLPTDLLYIALMGVNNA